MNNNARTLQDAIRFLHDQKHNGTPCPCCNRVYKVYNYSITGSMIAGMQEIYQRTAPGVFYETRGEGNQMLKQFDNGFRKAQYWDLIEPEIEQEEIETADGIVDKFTRHNNGHYRLTDLGRLYIEGETPVAQTMCVEYRKPPYPFNHTKLYVWQSLKVTFTEYQTSSWWNL